MTRLVSAVLARNEAAPDRYLRRVLTRLHEFSDTVLVLDDGSTDDTAQVARDLGCVVATRDSTGAWGAEAEARRDLWDRAAYIADGGWVLVCDADMVLCGDPRPLTQSWACASWAWPLADVWNDERLARVDGPWGIGAVTPRPWLFRPSALTTRAIWNERGVHCGHAPANFGRETGVCGVAPPDVYWLHLAYLQPTHRVAKHAQYMAIADQLGPFERAHAASILDA